MRSFLIILVGLSLSLNAFGQSEYSRYIVADSLKKTHVVKHKDGGDATINYLGVIKKSNGDTLYYVLTDFTRIQAAIVMHGHSTVIFLNKNLKKVKSYELSLPEELPYKLISNTLYFKYNDKTTNKKQVFKNKIGTTIPKMICVSPDSCY